MRLCIDKPRDIKHATFWIIAAISVHNFALEHEINNNFELDIFFQEGSRIIQEERQAEQHSTADDLGNEEGAQRNVACNLDLLRGRIKRQEHKMNLFSYLANNSEE